MTKKFTIGALLVSIVLLFSCGVSFAATDNTVRLGNEVSSSLNKGADTIGNVAEDVVGAGRTAVDSTGNAIRNMGDRMMGNTVNGNAMNGNTNTGYSTTRTTAEGTTNNAMGMSTTSWMWVIFAMAAIIIIAAIWYYAVQDNGKD